MRDLDFARAEREYTLERLCVATARIAEQEAAFQELLWIAELAVDALEESAALNAELVDDLQEATKLVGREDVSRTQIFDALWAIITKYRGAVE